MHTASTRVVDCKMNSFTCIICMITLGSKSCQKQCTIVSCFVRAEHALYIENFWSQFKIITSKTRQELQSMIHDIRKVKLGYIMISDNYCRWTADNSGDSAFCIELKCVIFLYLYYHQYRWSFMMFYIFEVLARIQEGGLNPHLHNPWLKN